MKICVNSPLPTVHLDNELNDCYTIDATFESNEDSSVDDCLNMFVKAMKLEGYFDASIVHSMQQYIQQEIANGLDLSMFHD